MNRLLGLDEELLRRTTSAEQAGYRMVSYLFLMVTVFSFVANSYFGFLLLRNWWGVVLLGLLMGYIHFSVLRIALISLMTKPLIKEKSAGGSVATKSIQRAFITLRQLNMAAVLRFVFVGLIAISICVPLATLFFHQQATQVEEVYRLQLAAALQTESIGSLEELQRAHFPFVIFAKLWEQVDFRLIVFVLFVSVYAPLVALVRLRNGNNSRYPELCRESMREEIAIDYNETLEQSQYFLDKNYPSFDRKLTELTPFADAPFKQVMKKGPARSYGSADDFRQFMRSR